MEDRPKITVETAVNISTWNEDTVREIEAAKQALREHVADRETGRKVRAGGCKGRAAAREDAREGRRRTWDMLLETYRSYRRKRPDKGRTWAKEKAAEQIGVSRATFYNLKGEFAGDKKLF
jgi:hypothetical protein